MEVSQVLEDHVFGRQTTKALVEFYPKHIEKEDKIFFPASKSYFTDEEDQSMLSEFWEFDREMILCAF